MKELLTRSVFGLLFLAVVFVPYYIDIKCNTSTFSLVLFLFSVIGTSELFRMAESTGYQKKGLIPALIVNLVLFTPALLMSCNSIINFVKHGVGELSLMVYSSSTLMEYALTIAAVLFVVVAGAYLLFSVQIFTRESVPEYFRYPILTSVFYPTLPFAVLAFVYSVSFSSPLLLFVLLPIYMNDTMAYVSGRLFGKHKMLPAVSPKKTWEGFIGGILGALLLMLGVMYLMDGDLERDGWLIALLSISASILATLGDLFESKLKRTAGVKDSGTILPGHGGILDRIDAMLFVAPILYVLLTLIS